MLLKCKKKSADVRFYPTACKSLNSAHSEPLLQHTDPRKKIYYNPNTKACLEGILQV